MEEALTSSLRLLPDHVAAEEYQVKGCLEGLPSLLLSILPPIPLPPDPHCLVSVANLWGEFRKEGVSSSVLHYLLVCWLGDDWGWRVLEGCGTLRGVL